MKNYFDILEKNKNLIMALGVEEKYEETRINWVGSKLILAKKLPVGLLTKKLHGQFKDWICKTEKKVEKITALDNIDRRNGVPYQERQKNISMLNLLGDMKKEYQDILNRRVKPVEDWITPSDWFFIKKNGLDRFLKVFYKKLT